MAARSQCGVWAILTAVAAGGVMLAGAALVPAAGDRTAQPGIAAAQSGAAEPAVRSSRVLSNEDWFNGLRTERRWRRSESSAPAGNKSTVKGPAPIVQPWSLFGPWGGWGDDDAPPQMAAPRPSGSYRTVCVRLCDGYYFPISAATTREHFAADEAACQSRCSSPARLFVYRSTGSGPQDMVDLTGQPYDKLKTAFLYRTTYDASCKCKAHPWEQEARLQHRVYALEEQRRKGSRTAVAELKEIKGQLKSQPVAAAPARTSKPVVGGTPVAPAPGPAVAASVQPGGPAAGVSAAEAGDGEAAIAAAKSGKKPSRVASGDRMPKPMGLGASPRRESDWKRRVLTPNYY